MDRRSRPGRPRRSAPRGGVAPSGRVVNSTRPAGLLATCRASSTTRRRIAATIDATGTSAPGNTVPSSMRSLGLGSNRSGAARREWTASRPVGSVPSGRANTAEGNSGDPSNSNASVPVSPRRSTPSCCWCRSQSPRLSYEERSGFHKGAPMGASRHSGPRRVHLTCAGASIRLGEVGALGPGRGRRLLTPQQGIPVTARRSPCLHQTGRCASVAVAAPPTVRHWAACALFTERGGLYLDPDIPKRLTRHDPRVLPMQARTARARPQRRPGRTVEHALRRVSGIGGCRSTSPVAVPAWAGPLWSQRPRPPSANAGRSADLGTVPSPAVPACARRRTRCPRGLP